MSAELFELINALLSSLGLCLLAIFARYFLIEHCRHGFQRTRMQAAIAIAVYMSGEVATRGWTWLARHLENVGADNRWMTAWPWGVTPMLTAAVAAAGLLCMIRVFTPGEWGNRGWLACAAIAAVATIAAGMIR